MVEDMFDYVKPILKHKPDYVVLHVGTNSAKDMTSRNILLQASPPEDSSIRF